jgi:hypothetical protein
VVHPLKCRPVGAQIVRQRERVVPVARPAERPACSTLAREVCGEFTTVAAGEEGRQQHAKQQQQAGVGLPQCNPFAKLTYLDHPRHACEATMLQLTALASQVRGRLVGTNKYLYSFLRFQTRVILCRVIFVYGT